MEKGKNNLGEILKEWFDKLPKNFGQAILDIGLEERVAEVANRHKLDAGLLVPLENEITKMLFGLSSEKEFEESLSEVLSLTRSELDSVLESITETIIDPIEKKVLLKRLGSTASSLGGIENTVAKIGKENGLHVDETGVLAEEIRNVVSGDRKAADFARNIKPALGLNDEETNKIVRAVNKEIFGVLRDSLQKATNKDSEEKLDRESILREIEGGPTKNTEKDFLKENVETTAEKQPVVKKTKATESNDILEDKLNRPVVIKREDTVQEDSGSAEKTQETINYKGEADPYRESIK